MADREEERAPLLQEVEEIEPPPQYTPYPNGIYELNMIKHLHSNIVFSSVI